MGFELVPDGTAGMAGQVIGNQVEFPARIGVVEHLEELQIAGGIPGARRLGERLAVSDRERSIDPDLRWSPIVSQSIWHMILIPE